MGTNPLNDYEEAVLREISKANKGTDKLGYFVSIQDLNNEFGDDPIKLQKAISKLISAGYIRDMKDKIEASKDVSVNYKAYQLTAVGDTVLSKNTVTNTNYSISGTANIAHNSPGTQQSIDIKSLDSDLQQKIEELQKAIESKDSSTIKKTFGYIADKSVDVAIALITQGMLK